jgi:HD-like signal output (HDOD) protein
MSIGGLSNRGTRHPLAPRTAVHTMQTSLTRFGRFELRALLGRSTRTMAWRAYDPVADREVMLSLPRVQPATPAAVEAWLRDARYASRLEHPMIVAAHEIGVQDHWPFFGAERTNGVTLREYLAANAEISASQVADWAAQILQALAFAHDAGVVHGDIQMQHLIVDDKGRVRVMAFATGGDIASADDSEAMRVAFRRDLVAVGVLMHRLLTGAAVLGEEDIGLAIQRIDPPSRSLVKLPWTTQVAVPQGLRAIVNRSTERVEKQRYQNARTFLNAIETWAATYVQEDGGVIEALIDRLHTVGLLPALPGVAECVAHLALMEGQRTDDIAVEVLGDMALSFELLRRANSSQVRATQVMGSNGPVLTIRRCIAMVGLDGIRFAANGLRSWPGPLAPADAEQLSHLFERVRLAGYVAQELRPAGYDAEIVYLLVAMQSLGRLMLHYHFPEEAAEVGRLMQPAPGSAATGGLETKGMGEDAAAQMVLGVDMEQIGSAVCRHWGLPDELLHMARRLSPDRPVRACESDFDLLRTTASAAIELVDAFQLPKAKVQGALVLVAQRYGRVLSLAPRDLASAMEGARRALRTEPAMPLPKGDGNADHADASTDAVGTTESARS